MTAGTAWVVLIIGLVTGAVTLIGGTLVVRFRKSLDRLLGFSSGTIIGVALFDLLPEGLDLAGDGRRHLTITTAVAVGLPLGRERRLHRSARRP